MEVKVDNSKGALIAFICMLIIGMVLTVWGCVGTINCIQFDKNYKETVGTVVSFNKTRLQMGSNSTESDRYKAVYEYEVDGKKYEVEESESSFIKPENGEQDVVYYDPANPETAKTKLGVGLNPTIALTGMVVFLVGLAFILARFKVNNRIVTTVFAILFLLVGIGYPLTMKSIQVALFTVWFAIIGVIIIFKNLH